MLRSGIWAVIAQTVISTILLGQQPARVDTTKLMPLTELGKGVYQGFEGGLYPGGTNERPAAHEQAGLELARKIQPLDRAGQSSTTGKIVLLSVGMSNTTQEFSAFKRLADGDSSKNSDLVIVDGAQGAMTAARISNLKDQAGANFWEIVDQRLEKSGVTRGQVQVAWLKQADAGPTLAFPRHARLLQERLAMIVHILHERFPNLQIVYLSSRIYAGFARTRLNPEPFAYETGFAVKWLIEQQLKGEDGLNYDARRGPVRAPWLGWGPYIWARETAKEPNGLAFAESDFAADGTHPSDSGRRKVAEQLLRFFKSDSTARIWFTKP